MWRSTRARSAKFGVSAEATFRRPATAVSQPASGGSQAGRRRPAAGGGPVCGVIRRRVWRTNACPTSRACENAPIMEMPASAELACLDGRTTPAEEATIPVVDEGFIRGDGIFEVIRVYNGKPYALHEHLNRLERSAGNLRLGWDPPREQLEAESAALLESRGGADFDGALRIVLTRGGRRLLLTELVAPAPEGGARVCFVTFAPTRILDGVKSLSYAANMLAGRLARDRGFHEALLVTPHGRVLEAPTASIFWVDDRGDLCTPPLE